MKNQKIVLEPKTQAFVDALAAQGGKPLDELSYADARKVLEDAQAAGDRTGFTKAGPNSWFGGAQAGGITAEPE